MTDTSKLIYQDANGETHVIEGVRAVVLEQVTDARIDYSDNVRVRDSTHVMVTGCRSAAVLDSDDVKVAGVRGLTVGGDNVWGERSERVLTTGSVGAILKARRETSN